MEAASFVQWVGGILPLAAVFVVAADRARGFGRSGSRWTSIVFVSAFALFFVLPGPKALAAAKTWTGNAANANWSTKTNWSPEQPSNDDSLIFTGTKQTANNNNITETLNFTGITFNSAAGAFLRFPETRSRSPELSPTTPQATRPST